LANLVQFALCALLMFCLGDWMGLGPLPPLIYATGRESTKGWFPSDTTKKYTEPL